MSYSWSTSTVSRTSTTRGKAAPTYSYGRRTADDSRTYTGRSLEATMDISYPLNRVISTKSPHPLVIAVDVTGSMSEWPRIFFDKVPLLYVEATKTRPDVEISFCAVGDAYCDEYPVQVKDFGAGPMLDELINKLYPEGGGGGNGGESYDLAAYYYSKYCMIPKAEKPVFIFMGDDYIFDVDPNQVKDFLGDDIEKGMTSKAVMGKLKERFDVYFIQKDDEVGVTDQWSKALGKNKVAILYDPKRIVDVILGIVAIADGDWEAYEKRLKDRQTLQQVEEVMKALKNIPK